MDFSNCTTVGLGESTYDRNTAVTALVCLILSLLALTTTIINSLVITAIVVTPKLHHPANYLICSLAVTDLLVAVLVMPFSIVYIAMDRWVMGRVVCNIWLSVDITCCTCSILHLAAIALDRYRAITDAVEYLHQRTPRRAFITIAAAWVISVSISVPPLAWQHWQGHAGNTDECLIHHDHIAFTLYSTLGAFYIPLALILILYYKIYSAAKNLYTKRGPGVRRESRRNSTMHTVCSERDFHSLDTLSPPDKSFSEDSSLRSPGAQSRRRSRVRAQRISSSRERRAAATLGLILGAFVVCWLPFFLKEVIVNTCASCSTSPALADFLAWLGYLNSLINPLLYTIFNEDFKKAFQKLGKQAWPLMEHRKAACECSGRINVG